MGHSRSSRQLALAAILVLSAVAARAADCPARAFADFVACAAGAAAGDTITLTSDVRPDGTPVTVNADVTVVNNGFQLVGIGALVKTGPGALTLPAANSYTGDTLVQGGTMAVGDALALGFGAVTLAGGRLLGLANFALGVSRIQISFPSGTIAAVPGATLGLRNVNVTADAGTARVTFGDATNNGAVEFTGTGTVSFNSTVTLAGGTARAIDTMLPTLLGLTESVSMDTTALLDTNGQNFILGSIQGTGQIALNGSSSMAIVDGAYAGVISGNGTLVKDTAAGTLVLSGNNTYTGPTVITGGILRIGDGGTTGTLGTGPVNNNFELSFNRTDAYEISQRISGTGTLRVESSGTLTLSGTNTYTGPTFVDIGTLSVTGSNQASSTTVATNGAVRGTGATGNIDISLGTLRPGLSPAQAGTLTTGSLDLGPLSALEAKILGPAAGTQYDQVNAIGTVRLANATLRVSGGYVPVAGDTFVLIANDGTDPVAGTFASLPEGATALFNGVLLRISYAGGDGNDVVLSVVTHAVAPSAGPNGGITPNLSQLVAHGGTTTFTVTPNVGFTALVGGTCGGTLVGTTFTTGVITADCTVAATFVQNVYTVTPGAGPNGTIAPNAPQNVGHGGTTAFTVSPNTGFTASVGGTCGGTLVGTTFTTNPIVANCTVAATFTPLALTVTPSAGPGGAITPGTPQTVAFGGTATFTVTPDAGFAEVVRGTCGGSLVGNTYTTHAITANCTVVAAFIAGPVTTFTGPTATGTGDATASFTGGGPTCSFAVSQFILVTGDAASPPSGSAPPGLVFPHGLFDFRLTSCVPGSTITMTITYPSGVPGGSAYWKFGPEPANPAPHWYMLPATLGTSTAVFSIRDGAQGDDDLAANGTLVDQGGPASPATGGTAEIPTLSQWALLLLAALMLATGCLVVPAKARTRFAVLVVPAKAGTRFAVLVVPAKAGTQFWAIGFRPAPE